METEIIKTASELFLNLGFKSVTMDDIAQQMGISKKTIYKFYSTKNKLVSECTLHLFSLINEGIQVIREQNLNAIEELYEIKKFIMFQLKNEKTSPEYQLEKHYPKIFNELNTKRESIVLECIQTNLKKGIKENLYRKDIDTDFISKLYYSSVITIKTNRFSSTKLGNIKNLIEKFLEYHIRGISTKKGNETLLKILSSTNEK